MNTANAPRSTLSDTRLPKSEIIEDRMFLNFIFVFLSSCTVSLMLSAFGRVVISDTCFY